MPGPFAFFAFLFRYLWPFIKEWFFDKRTVIRWFKRHYIVFFLTLGILFQAYLTWKMLIHTIAVKEQVTQIQSEHKKIVEQRDQNAARNAILIQQITKLTSEKDALNEKVNLYEHWMSACGMDFTRPEADMPSCTNVNNNGRWTAPGRSSGKQSGKSTNRRKPSNNSELTDRVRQLWGQNK